VDDLDDLIDVTWNGPAAGELAAGDVDAQPGPGCHHEDDAERLADASAARPSAPW